MRPAKKIISHLIRIALTLSFTIFAPQPPHTTAQVATGSNIVAMAQSVQNPNIFLAGTDSKGIQLSLDGGTTWSYSNQGLSGYALSPREIVIAPTAPYTIYAGTLGGLARSTNMGLNWNMANTGLAQTCLFHIALAKDNPAIIYGGTCSTGVFKSMNGGTSWIAANAGLTNTQIVRLAAPTQDVVYAATWGRGMFKSTDGGATWAEINQGITDKYMHVLLVDPQNSSTVYASTYGAGIFKSTNGGASWQTVNLGLGDLDIRSLEMHPTNTGMLFAGTTTHGVYKSVNGGASWVHFATVGTPNQVEALLISRDNQFLFSGSAFGVIKIPLQTGSTSNCSTLSGYGWAMRTSVSDNDGLIVEDVRYGPRYLARKLSLPYLEAVYDPVLISPAGTPFTRPTPVRVELKKSALLQPNACVDHRDDAVKSVSVSASYLITNVVNGLSLKVTQEYRFAEYVPGDGCEPSSKLPCARFWPTVSYEWVGAGADSSSYWVKAVQRMNFDPDGETTGSADVTRNVPDFINAGEDNLSANGYLKREVIGLGFGDGRLYARAIGKTPPRAWDNYHYTFRDAVGLPGSPLSANPGCSECVHIHWMWREITNLACDKTGDHCWTDGQPQTLPGSPQLGAWAITKREDATPIRYESWVNDEKIAAKQRPTDSGYVRAETEFWYAGVSTASHDTFFPVTNGKNGGTSAAFFAPAQTVPDGMLSVERGAATQIANTVPGLPSGWLVPVTLGVDEAVCANNPLLFSLNKLDVVTSEGSGELHGLFYLMVDSDAKLLNPESAYTASPAGLPYAILRDNLTQADIVAGKSPLRKFTLSQCKNDAKRMAFLVFDKAPTQLNIQIVRSPYGFHNGAKPYIPAAPVPPMPSGHKAKGLAKPNNAPNNHHTGPVDCTLCPTLVNAVVDVNVISFTAQYNGQVSLRGFITNTSSSVLIAPTLRISSLYDGFIPGATEPMTREIMVPISYTSPLTQGGWPPGMSLPITLNVKLAGLQGFDFYLDVYASTDQPHIFDDVDRDNVSTYIQLTHEVLLTNAQAKIFLPLILRK